VSHVGVRQGIGRRTVFGAREYTLGDKGNLCIERAAFFFLRRDTSGPPFLQRSRRVAKRQLDAQNKLTNKITFVEK